MLRSMGMTTGILVVSVCWSESMACTPIDASRIRGFESAPSLDQPLPLNVMVWVPLAALTSQVSLADDSGEPVGIETHVITMSASLSEFVVAVKPLSVLRARTQYRLQAGSRTFFFSTGTELDETSVVPPLISEAQGSPSVGSSRYCGSWPSRISMSLDEPAFINILVDGAQADAPWPTEAQAISTGPSLSFVGASPGPYSFVVMRFTASGAKAVSGPFTVHVPPHESRCSSTGLGLMPLALAAWAALARKKNGRSASTWPKKS